MARDFGPFPSKPMYEVVNRRMQRALAKAVAATGFTALSQGVVSAGTGAQLVIAAYPDGALVDGLYVENPASETVTLTTNASSSPRIDRLVMRLDMGAQTIAPFQIVGTPAASPQVPPLVQTSNVFDMPLCRYTMPGSGSAQNPGSIVDERLTLGGSLQTVNWPNATIAGTNNIPTPTRTAYLGGAPYRLRVAASLETTLGGAGTPYLQLFIDGARVDQFRIRGVNGTNDLYPAKASRTMDITDGRAVGVFARLDIPAGVTATTYFDDAHSWLTVEVSPL